MTRITTTYKQDSKLAFGSSRYQNVSLFKENVQIGRSIILIYQEILFQLKYSG